MTLHCGGKKGDPQIDILTDNDDCPDCSLQESLVDLSNVATEGLSLIKAVLEELVNSTGKEIRAIKIPFSIINQTYPNLFQCPREAKQ
jgi:hypothetical protein